MPCHRGNQHHCPQVGCLCHVVLSSSCAHVWSQTGVSETTWWNLSHPPEAMLPRSLQRPGFWVQQWERGLIMMEIPPNLERTSHNVHFPEMQRHQERRTHTRSDTPERAGPQSYLWWFFQSILSHSSFSSCIS